jgi:hypothetical protein
MFIDSLLELSDSQSVTSSAKSTNEINMGAAKWAKGTPMAAVFTVDEAFTASESATMTLELYVNSATNPSSGGTQIYSSGAISKSTLVAGYRKIVPLSPEIDGTYIEAYHTVASGPMTAGKISTVIVPLESIQTNEENQ